jgi:cytochrome c
MRNLILAGLGVLSLTVSARADGDVTAGANIFKRCTACHAIDKPQNRVGPHLDGIFGRKVASIEDYKYSEAMKAKGEAGAVWDEATLTAYLSDPRGVVPGNKMAFAGVKKPDELANLIAFLKTKPAL